MAAGGGGRLRAISTPPRGWRTAAPPRWLLLVAVALVAAPRRVLGGVEMGATASHNLNLQEVDSSVVAKHWLTRGAAAVHGDMVQLTPDEQSVAGFVESRFGAKHAGTEWVVEAEFRLHGRGITLFGDGVALWLTYDRFRPGPVFGREKSWHGLGIFLDTYDNTGGRHTHKHPYVSAMYNDGTLEYMHDDTGTHSSAHEDVGCSARLRQYGKDDKVVGVRVAYRSNAIRVSLVLGQRGDVAERPEYEFMDCFTMNHVSMEPGFFLAASASTGDLTDQHDLLSLRLRGEQGSPPAPSTPTLAGVAAVEGEAGDCPPLSTQGKLLPNNAGARPPPLAPPPTPPPPSPPQPSPAPHVDLPPPDRAAAAPPAAVEAADGDDSFSLEDIDAAVASTDIVRMIRERAEANQGRLQLIHDQLDAKAVGLHQHLEEILLSMQRTEKGLDERLKAAEARIGARVQEAEDVTVAASGSWRLPFALLVVAVIVASFVAYRRYRFIMKTHML